MQNPYKEMSFSDLQEIAKDILDSKKRGKRAESLIPYAKAIHENLNGTTETITLRECIEIARNDFYEEVLKRFSSGSVSIQTPKGEIAANIMPDDEYIGIGLFYKEPGSGEPGAIMEYNPNIEQIQMRVWTKDHPDDDPADVYQMTE